MNGTKPGVNEQEEMLQLGVVLAAKLSLKGDTDVMRAGEEKEEFLPLN